MAARVGLPLALFAIGARMASGSLWRRSFVGMLYAVAGMFAHTVFLPLFMLVDLGIEHGYYAMEIVGAIAVIGLGLAMVLLFRKDARLWQKRYMAYCALIVGGALVYMFRDMIDQITSDAYVEEYWVSVLIADSILLALALLAYFALRGVSLTLRAFRVVLIIMTAMMALMAMSFLVSAIAASGAGMEIMYSNLYGIVSIVAPLAVYALAVWWARPATTKKLSVRKPAAAKS